MRAARKKWYSSESHFYQKLLVIKRSGLLCTEACVDKWFSFLSSAQKMICDFLQRCVRSHQTHPSFRQNIGWMFCAWCCYLKCGLWRTLSSHKYSVQGLQWGRKSGRNFLGSQIDKWGEFTSSAVFIMIFKLLWDSSILLVSVFRWLAVTDVNEPVLPQRFVWDLPPGYTTD